MKHIMIVGAGAMGSLFGARLAEAGFDVTLIDVWREHIDAINRDGLTLSDDRGTRSIPIRASLAHEADVRPDLAIVFTKTLHTGAALQSVTHLFSGETLLLTLQNGLGNVDTAAQFVAPSRIMHGVTTCPSDLQGPGAVSSHGDGYVRINGADGHAAPAFDAVAAALVKAGFDCTLDPDVDRAIWEKVAFNAALNSVTAVTRLTVGGVGGRDAGRQLAQAIVGETCAVAHAKDIPARPDAVMQSVMGAFEHHAGHQPSMLQDILAGRKTEIGAINGAIVSAARELGVPVPVTETLYRLVCMIE